MKKNKIFLSAISAIALVSLQACNSFLDEQPSASVNAPITEASQLLSLYDNTNNILENDYPGAYATDDYSIPLQMYASQPNSFSTDAMAFYAIESSVMETSSSNQLWTVEYAKIFKANTIITNSGSVNGTKEEINEALANGYMLRAWSYFKLATTYCLPYSEANRSKLGLPLRLGVVFTEDISRKSLGETFDLILSDLKNAETLCVEEDVNPDLAWRASKVAIYGFYARVYLYMNDYNKALEYINKAVDLSPALFNFNGLAMAPPVEYPATSIMPAQTLNYCETNSWNTKDIYKWKEWVYIRLQYLPTQWLCPSQELVDSYEKDNDLRFKLFYVEHGNRRFSVPYDSYRYDAFSDGRYNFSGLTTGELLLMKAELMARTGDWQNALAILTPLRQARFTTGTATPLTATSQSEALKKILQERRRELAFSCRLMDIKRYAMSETPDDDVSIIRDFYSLTQSGVDMGKVVNINLKGNSPKLAIPIPTLDLQNSQGAIEQNSFE